MVIYNVTININHDAHDEWLIWMKSEHIPEVMNTGMFTEYKILRLIGDHDSGGTTYAIQYSCVNMQNYERYRDEFGPALQKKTLAKFGDKFTAFRSLLETV